MMNESTGAMLRQAREQRHLTLQQVADKTKIRSHYLQALENDDLATMPSSAQARGFLRIYADFLGLDQGKLIAAQPAGDAGAATLSPAAVPGSNNPDDAPGSGRPRPGLFSTLGDLWSRRGSGRAPAAQAANADSSVHAGEGEASGVSPAEDGSATSELPGGDSPPEASIDSLDEAKKKALN